MIIAKTNRSAPEEASGTPFDGVDLECVRRAATPPLQLSAD